MKVDLTVSLSVPRCSRIRLVIPLPNGSGIVRMEDQALPGKIPSRVLKAEACEV
jgi:hypothetical protein